MDGRWRHSGIFALHTSRHAVKVNEYLPCLVLCAVLVLFSSFFLSFLLILRKFLHLRNFCRILWPFECCCSFGMLCSKNYNRKKVNTRRTKEAAIKNCESMVSVAIAVTMVVALWLLLSCTIFFSLRSCSTHLILDSKMSVVKTKF